MASSTSRLSRATCALIVGSVIWIAGTPASAQTASITVLKPVAGGGAKSRHAARATRAVAAAVSGRSDVRLVKHRMTAQCVVDAGCLTAAKAAASADRIVGIRVAKAGSRFKVSFLLLDTATGQTLARQDHVLTRRGLKADTGSLLVTLLDDAAAPTDVEARPGSKPKRRAPAPVPQPIAKHESPPEPVPALKPARVQPRIEADTAGSPPDASVAAEVTSAATAAKPSPAPRYRARASVGGGRSDEQATGVRGTLYLQVGGAVELSHGIRLGLRLTDRFYDQTYRSRNPNLTGDALDHVDVDEQFLDVRMDASAEILRYLFSGDDPVATLNVGLAPRYFRLDNGAFDSWSGGVEIGGQLELHPADAFHLFGGASFTPSLFGTDDNLSVMGQPKSLSDFGAGVRFDFGDDTTWSVELGWQSSVIIFEYTTRVFHAATAGLAVAL